MTNQGRTAVTWVRDKHEERISLLSRIQRGSILSLWHHLEVSFVTPKVGDRFPPSWLRRYGDIWRDGPRRRRCMCEAQKQPNDGECYLYPFFLQTSHVKRLLLESDMKPMDFSCVLKKEKNKTKQWEDDILVRECTPRHIVNRVMQGHTRRESFGCLDPVSLEILATRHTCTLGDRVDWRQFDLSWSLVPISPVFYSSSPSASAFPPQTSASAPLSRASHLFFSFSLSPGALSHCRIAAWPHVGLRHFCYLRQANLSNFRSHPVSLDDDDDADADRQDRA